MADSFEQVVEKEWRDYVQPRRAQQERSGAEDADPNQRNLTGLAISGGGIRSASFAVGVLQVLAERGILSKFDYLSTVSGGGYTGGAVSYDAAEAEPDADPLGEDFVFGKPDAVRDEDVSDNLRFLRKHGNYLTPGSGINVAAFVGMLLRAIGVNLLVWLPLLVLIMAVSQRALVNEGAYIAAGVGTFFLGLSSLLTLASAICITSFFGLDRKRLDENSHVLGIQRSAMRRWFPSVTTAAIACALLGTMPGAVPPDFVAGGNGLLGLLLDYAGFVIAFGLFLLGNRCAKRTSPEGDDADHSGSVIDLLKTARAIYFYAGLSLLFGCFSVVNDRLDPGLDTVNGSAVEVVVASDASGEAAGELATQAEATKNKPELKVNAPVFAAARWLAMSVGLVIGGSILLYAFLTPIEKAFGSEQSNSDEGLKSAYRRRRRSVRLFGWAVPAALLLALVGAIPGVAGLIKLHGGLASLGSGAALGLWRILSKGGGESRVKLEWVAPLAAFLLLYGLVVIAYYVVEFFDSTAFTWLVVAAGVAFAIGYFTNVNHLSIGRYYRDRLIEAFMPDTPIREPHRNRPASKADAFNMSDMADKRAGPLHIVNTLAVLKDSVSDPTVRQRGGDNFAITPLHVGSKALRWHSTKAYLDGELTLGTAVATSAAAVSPHAGVAGKGLSTNGAISVLMALFNIRLGFWTPNPNYRSILPQMHHFWAGWYEISPAAGYRERSYYIHLTDGGHYENLALYELFKRKLRVIVALDGGADPEFHFEDLQNALHRAESDMGVKVHFRSGIEDLIPQPQAENQFPDGLKLAETGFILGDIEYGEGAPDGLLIYLKTTLVNNMSMRVRGYKSAHPDFPDETTADQFFSPDQFDAYRLLGVAIAEQLFDSRRELPGKAAEDAQSAPADWLVNLFDEVRGAEDPGEAASP